MSNEENPKPEQVFAENVHNLMLHRSRRLVRLIKLGAPDLILCNEVKLLNNMLPLLGETYKSFMNHEMDRQTRIQKNKLGVCANKDCFNNSAKIQAETAEGSHFCKNCKKEQDLRQKALEESYETDLSE